MKTTAENYLEIVKADYEAGYKLRLSFSDGVDRGDACIDQRRDLFEVIVKCSDAKRDEEWFDIDPGAGRSVICQRVDEGLRHFRSFRAEGRRCSGPLVLRHEGSLVDGGQTTTRGGRQVRGSPAGIEARPSTSLPGPASTDPVMDQPWPT